MRVREHYEDEKFFYLWAAFWLQLLNDTHVAHNMAQGAGLYLTQILQLDS
jgi:hypothetical protein